MVGQWAMTDCDLQPCMYEGYNNYIKQFMARKLWCKKIKYLLQLKTIYFFSFFYFMSSELWTKNKQADQGYIVHKVVQCNSMRRNDYYYWKVLDVTIGAFKHWCHIASPVTRWREKRKPLVWSTMILSY